MEILINLTSQREIDIAKVRAIRNDVHMAEREIEDAIGTLLKKHEISSLGVSLSVHATTESGVSTVDMVIANLAVTI